VGSQHPDGHVDGVQLGGVLEHCWFEQKVPLTPQLAQKSPERPHSAVCVPGSHRPVAMSMQPLHGWQVPETHDCRLGHATHAAPPLPQRAVVGGF
jgi:hypothetical protein